jgi:hypothetical protein
MKLMAYLWVLVVLLGACGGGGDDLTEPARPSQQEINERLESMYGALDAKLAASEQRMYLLVAVSFLLNVLIAVYLGSRAKSGALKGSTGSGVTIPKSSAAKSSPGKTPAKKTSAKTPEK